jgi:hypothetical protein
MQEVASPPPLGEREGGREEKWAMVGIVLRIAGNKRTNNR